MADPLVPVFPFPATSATEAAALAVAAAYLHRAGTQAASRLLGHRSPIR